MKTNKIATVFLASAMLLALPACGKTEKTDPAPTETLTPPAVQTAKPEPIKPSAAPTASPTTDAPQSTPKAAVSTDDEWKVKFEKELLEKYEATPVKYEDLGNGIYQVYVERDGKVIPFVTVDSATGDYHG